MHCIMIDGIEKSEMEVIWRGHFFSDDAYDKCLLLDAMRQSGDVLTLSWGGQSKRVVIADFIYRVRRLPVWVEYSITCTVLTNPMMGTVGAAVSSFDQMIGTDLATADAAVARNAAVGLAKP